jgi:formylglycine-generating enzyme required for sulfatase activity
MYTLEEIYLKLISIEQKLDAIADCVNCGDDTNVTPTPAGMSLIPAGEFVMGDTFDEGDSWEQPLHTVFISAFYMDQYEVTKALWDEVSTWAATNGYSFGSTGPGKSTNHPVHSVDWYDAIAWCNARSEREGLSPSYTNANGTVYRDASGNSFDGGCNWSLTGYRLPTEAEWEYAARGGVADQRFPWGDTITHSDANYYALPSGYTYDVNPTDGYHPTFATGDFPYTSPVGHFAPNGYGLYDMAGNVFEWCWDWFGQNYYSSSPSTDPRGPSSGDYGSRVLRGASWFLDAIRMRVANRIYNVPDIEGNNIGIRCARGL